MKGSKASCDCGPCEPVPFRSLLKTFCHVVIRNPEIKFMYMIKASLFVNQKVNICFNHSTTQQKRFTYFYECSAHPNKKRPDAHPFTRFFLQCVLVKKTHIWVCNVDRHPRDAWFIESWNWPNFRKHFKVNGSEPLTVNVFVVIFRKFQSFKLCWCITQLCGFRSTRVCKRENKGCIEFRWFQKGGRKKTRFIYL